MTALLVVCGSALFVWWLLSTTYHCSQCGREFVAIDPEPRCPRCRSNLTWRVYS